MIIRPRIGWSPPAAIQGTLSHCHFVEDRVPLRCLDIGAHIFIKSRSWAAVVSSYFKSLVDFGIIGQIFFILPSQPALCNVPCERKFLSGPNCLFQPLFSRVLRDSTPSFVRRSVGPSVGLSNFTFFMFLRSLASLLLPKCSSDLKY